jgi:peptidoglycan/xylan/chitin deacetylase (PgdA/CDA1 family)
MQRARVSPRHRGVVLLYHRIEPRRGDPTLEFSAPIHRDAFAAHVRHLARMYRVVPATGLLDAIHERRRGERFPVAITFDDDSETHLRWAVPVLQRVGVTATFFLNGASLQTPRATWWWELMQLGLERGIGWAELLPSAVLAEVSTGAARPTVASVGEAVKRMSVSDRRSLNRRLGELVGTSDHSHGMRDTDVRTLAEAGFEIGFHTVDHEPLALVDEATLHEQLRKGRGELEDLCGAPLRSIAYPHGSADDRVAAAARVAGFTLGFTSAPVSVEPTVDPMLVGRVDVTRCPGASELAGLVAWMLVTG